MRFALLIGLGVVLRALLILTSIGTNDVLNWMTFGRLVDHVGVGAAYSKIAEINHPPLSLLILLMLEKVRGLLHLEIGDLLRLLQIAFDLVAVAALIDIGRSTASRSPHGLALFYFLSPVSIFVTGFHGNTDPAMVALLLVSLALLVRSKPVFAGVFFALAVGIKIIPLLLLPLIVIWSRDRIRFAAGAAITGAVIFLPFASRAMLMQIFGYNTQAGNYGFPYFVGTFAPRIAEMWIANARYLIAAAVVIYGVVLVRKSRTSVALLAGTGTTMLIILSLSPGIGMQYFLWPIAFLPFALSRWESYGLSATYGVAQFTVYTIWSDGFPWWYADSTISRPGIDLMLFGNLVWLLTLAATIKSWCQVWKSNF